MRITDKTLGRVATLGRSAAVAGLGGWLAQTPSYAVMYVYSLVIPVISVPVSLLEAGCSATVSMPQIRSDGCLLV